MKRPYAIGLMLPLLAACGHMSPPAATLPPTLATGWEAPNQFAIAETAALSWWENYNDPILNALIETALTHNADVRLAAERILQATAYRRGAGRELLPNISGSAGITEDDSDAAANRRDYADAGLSVSWEIDISGRLTAALRAARANARATVADAEAVRQALTESVTRTYIDYRLQRALLNLTIDTVRAQESTLRLTKDRYELGVAGDLDVQRAQVLLSQTMAQEANARAAADIARFRLATLLASTPSAILDQLGADGPVPMADPIAVLQTPSALLAHRPDVKAARALYDAAAARRQVAAAARWPSLSLFGLLGVEGQDIGAVLDGQTQIRSLGASLTAPIFDFGRLSAQYDAAASELRQAEIVYEQTARGALEEAQTALVLYVQETIRLGRLSDAATAAQKAAEISQLQYTEGTLSQFEVLDADRTVYQAQREEVQSRALMSASLAGLYRSMAFAPDPSQTLAELPQPTASP